MTHIITLIPGDGIGPEVSSAVVRIIEAAGVQVQWETHYAGAQALEKYGATLPDDLLESIKRNRVALKGPVTTPVGRSRPSRLRIERVLQGTEVPLPCGVCTCDADGAEIGRAHV